MKKFSVTIPDLASIPGKTELDGHTVLAIVSSAPEQTEITKKDQEKLCKTSMKIYDKS